MRKLVIFCFAVCMTVLTVLSLFNFAQDAEESMILGKRAVILEKPETLSNREFLGQIDTALGKIGADIMYRYAELDGDKPLYRYYKTSHTDSFLSVSTGKGSVRLESDEFFSTARQPGAMALHLSSLFQDTAIYPLMQAQQHDLTAATWYVAEGQLDAVLHALKGLGYSVTATNERLLSTKLPLYFLFIPAFMLCVSIVFYTLSAGKKNVLKKMEGYTTGNILLGEIKAYRLEPALLSIGVTRGEINFTDVRIYDRDRTICDVLRNMNKMDKEIFNKAIQGYVNDPQKNVPNLIEYAKTMRVWNKVKNLIGVWL